MEKHFTNSYWYESRLKAKARQRSYWKKRNEFAAALEAEGFEVHEYDNCWRLHASKNDKEYLIDCQEGEGFPTSAIFRFQEEPDTFDDIIYEVYGYYDNGMKFPNRDKDKYKWTGHEWTLKT
jgi:hypothetical protein